MATLASGSYSHKCTKISHDTYQISWSVDFKPKGSRVRYPRRMSRITDTKGAQRFCKRWGIS